MSDKDIEEKEFKDKEPIDEAMMGGSEKYSGSRGDEIVFEKKKTIIRIPTQQYAYIEMEVSVETLDELKTIHDSLYETLNQKPGDGLAQKEWNTTLDGYLRGDGTNSETFSRMSEKQQYMIQELKKSFKRTVNNLEK